MGRILGLDYGTKKCGLSVTDELQIIVNPIGTVETRNLIDTLKEYNRDNIVDKIVIGKPMHKDGSDTFLKVEIDKLVTKFSILFPSWKVDFENERYTSKQAREIILKSGISKKRRRDKTLVDKISAVLILQSYLGHI